MATTPISEENDVFLKRALICVAVFILVVISWLELMDQYSADYIDGAIVQASLAFGTARLLNGIISVLQSIEVSAAVVSLSPGEILDPLNDVVEQFAGFMQISVASLVLQKVLLAIVSQVYFKVALTIAGICFIASSYFGSERFTKNMLKTVIFMVFLRFSMVAVLLLTGAVDKLFLVDETRQDMALLEELPSSIDVMNESAAVTATPAQDSVAVQAAIESEFELREEALRGTAAGFERDISKIESSLAEAEQRLQSITAQLSTMQKLNPLDRTPEHTAALAEIAGIENLLELKTDGLEETQQLLRALSKERVALTEAGEGDGFWSSIGSGIGGMASKMAKLGNPETYMELVRKMDGVMDTIISVMVLFFLKTMLIPIAFMMVFVRVCKALWGIDMYAMTRISNKKSRPAEAQNA